MDELEKRLQQLTPTRASQELRTKTLAAIRSQLASDASPDTITLAPKPDRPAIGWSRWIGSAVCLLLLLSIASNWWVNRSLDQRLAQIMGPPPRQRQADEIAQEIAAITDEQMGEWMYQRLTRKPKHRPFDKTYFAKLDEFIKQLNLPVEKTYEAS